MTSCQVRCPVNACEQMISSGVNCLSTFAEGQNLTQRSIPKQQQSTSKFNNNDVFSIDSKFQTAGKPVKNR